MASCIFKANPKLHHQLFLFDVGHGDCVLVFDHKKRGLLVDIGTLKNIRLYQWVPRWIGHFCSSKKETGFIISHYHCDHYNLFRFLPNPDKLFSNIYLPMIPVTGIARQIGLAVYNFLELAFFSGYMHYRILPELFRSVGKPPIPCKSGAIIREANLTLKVIWPDFTDKIFVSKIEIAQRVRSITDKLLKRLKLPIPADYGEEYSLKFFLSQLWELRGKEFSEEEKENIWSILSEIENEFRILANSISLVCRTNRGKYSRFLFLGDLEDRELNALKIPGKPEYDCIKAAHHGTTFGKSLKNLKTHYLLLSRNQRQYRKIRSIHVGYFKALSSKKILSTESFGNCLIL